MRYELMRDGEIVGFEAAAALGGVRWGERVGRDIGERWVRGRLG